MTDNEIINMLKCCGNTDCTCCEYGKDCDGYTAVRNALDLINRLQAENERLKKELADISVRTLKRFEKEIKDVKFTLGQTWEIQCALKNVLKEMVGENNAE